MTAIGKLRHLVTIKRPIGRDTAGQPQTGSVEVATVWADVRHPNGLETIKSDAELSIVKASIRIRYLDGIVAGMWVEHDGETYDIRAVLKDPTGRRYLDLVCQTGARRA
ncbi:head closure protein [Variovorax phage VarioGold]|uniref:phage head closure protein n=1 Tax=Variovorax sp. ZS18.2.2 TaxID=2971255 RepID=UPI00215128F1|nr:phage head closure protein [Variovorax sp. ZS18.2.2]MCR6477529.1 phage head closure protein [Variovorax sp. ZS18.2.2]UYD72056.1 head closure protein [Variovorax phage VarioGold]